MIRLSVFSLLFLSLMIYIFSTTMKVRSYLFICNENWDLFKKIRMTPKVEDFKYW